MTRTSTHIAQDTRMTIATFSDYWGSQMRRPRPGRVDIRDIPNATPSRQGDTTERSYVDSSRHPDRLREPGNDFIPSRSVAVMHVGRQLSGPSWYRRLQAIASTSFPPVDILEFGRAFMECTSLLRSWALNYKMNSMILSTVGRFRATFPVAPPIPLFSILFY